MASTIFSPRVTPIATSWLQDVNDLTYGLGAPDGARLVSFTQEGVGAVTIPLDEKLQDSISAADFGAIGDGVTNDTDAILAACVSLAPHGGAIVIPRGYKVLLDTNITIPKNCVIVGPYCFTGSPGNNASAPYGDMGAIIVNSAATVSLASGAGLVGVLMYRKGMTFPAADASAFSGTCITVAGDDCYVSKSMVLGFNKAILSNGFQRPRIEHLYHDNVNGVDIQVCYDIPRVTNCHAWPFSTIATGAASTKDIRAGFAYRSVNGGDWNKITDCFSWGYQQGFIVDNCNSVTLSGCGADHLGGVAGCTGFTVIGASQDTRLVSCQAAAQETGYNVSTSTGLHTRMNGCDSWASALRGVLAGTGDLTVSGGVHRNSQHGILINTTTGTVNINGVRGQNNSVSDVGFNVANSTTYISSDCDLASFSPGTSAISGTPPTALAVASASTLPIPNTGSVFNVTGTTNINRVSCGWLGREVTLVFVGALTVVNNTGAQDFIRLSGATNFIVTGGGSLTVRHNGTQWYETGRSV